MVLAFGVKTLGNALTENNNSIADVIYPEETLNLSKKVMQQTEHLSGNTSNKEEAVQTVSDAVDNFNESLNYALNMEKYLNNSDFEDSDENSVNEEAETTNTKSYDKNSELEGIVVEIKLK